MGDNDFATGYALGSDSGNNNNGFLGGEGLWAILIFAMIFGYGNWGNGGYGGGNGINSPAGQGALTRADLCSEFNFNNLDNAVRGIQQGICDSVYALNNTVTGGFNSTNVAMACAMTWRRRLATPATRSRTRPVTSSTIPTLTTAA